jgi:hypothetical protein
MTPTSNVNSDSTRAGVYVGCPLYAEHGACYCSTGVPGDCRTAAPTSNINEGLCPDGGGER